MGPSKGRRFKMTRERNRIRYQYYCIVTVDGEDCPRMERKHSKCRYHYKEAIAGVPFTKDTRYEDKPICEVDGCDREARGWKTVCSSHYMQELHGVDDLTPLKAIRKQNMSAEEMLEYLMEHTVSRRNRVMGSPCKLSTLTPNSGGYIPLSWRNPATGKYIRTAHRTIATIRFGAQPKGKPVVRHFCGNKTCLEHLAWGTHSENAHDREKDIERPYRKAPKGYKWIIKEGLGKCGALVDGKVCGREEGCCKNLCAAHHTQKLKGHVFHEVRRSRKRNGFTDGDLLELLYSQCIEEGECLRRQVGRASTGYTNVAFDGRPQGAHRVVALLWHGEPPKGMNHVDHLCGNRDCIFPKHLRYTDAKGNCETKYKLNPKLGEQLAARRRVATSQ